jgi:hypothetical protein
MKKLIFTIIFIVIATSTFSQIGLTEKQIRKTYGKDITCGKCDKSFHYIETMQPQTDGTKMLITYYFNDDNICYEIIVSPTNNYQALKMDKLFNDYLLNKEKLPYMIFRTTAPVGKYYIYYICGKTGSKTPINIEKLKL